MTSLKKFETIKEFYDDTESHLGFLTGRPKGLLIKIIGTEEQVHLIPSMPVKRSAFE